MRIPWLSSPRHGSGVPVANLGTQTVGLTAPPPSLDFQKLMGRDELTGLPNRHAFEHVLAQQAALAQRLQTRLSLLIIQCDDYPAFAAGHEIATRERHLIALARNLRGCCRRAYDVVGSLQPGQFAALLPFTDAAGADVVARNMAQALEMPTPDEDVEPALAAAAELGYVPLLPLEPELPALREPGLGISKLSIGIAVYCGKGSLCDRRMYAVADEACRIVQAGGGGRALRRDTPLTPGGLGASS